jgi:hypothetical protein
MNRRTLIFAAPLCALLLTGCFTATPRLDGFAHRLEGTMPGTHFEAQGGIKLGRLSLGLARAITRSVDDEDAQDASLLLAGLKRVEVAHYEVSGLAPDTLPAAVERSFHRNGWRTMARVRDEDASSWVLYRMEDDSLRSLFVVTLDGEELGLVRLEGRLDLVVEAALRMSRDEVRDDPEPESDETPAAIAGV